jgi:hypothetical protein
MSKFLLNEGLEQNDLKRLVNNDLHIDEFKSKLGKDSDVVVLSFKVTGKEPAVDLVNFIEKGYDWVIDADVSSGELDDGDYLVFVECDRDQNVPEQIVSLIDDLENITDIPPEDWYVRYKNIGVKEPLTYDVVKSLVPLSAQDYQQRFSDQEIDKLKTAAGVKVDTKAPKNDFTESLRIAAGIL